MKKFVFSLCLIFACIISLCGCSNSTQNLAKNLDDTITNLVYAVSALDWADSELVGDLSSINLANINETTQANDAPENELQTTPLTTDKKIVGGVQMNSTMSGSKTARPIFSRNKISKINGNQNTQNETIDNLNSRLKTANPLENTQIVTVKYTTQNIETQTNEVMERLASLVQRRTNILLYVNALYNSKITLTQDMISAINAYINIIKDNTAYLNSNKGMVTNQLSQASSIKLANTYSPLINAYIIRTSEAISTRIAKLDASIMAIDSIIEILEASSPDSAISYINNIKQNASVSPLVYQPAEQETTENNQKIVTENKIAENTQNTDDNIPKIQENSKTPAENLNIIKNEQNIQIEQSQTLKNDESSKTETMPAEEGLSSVQTEEAKTASLFIDKHHREHGGAPNGWSRPIERKTNMTIDKSI